MVEIYDTHEQSEIVKSWLRENGGAIVLGLVLAFGSLFGFKQWQLWEQNQNQQASAEYDVMLALLDQSNLDGAVANYETLKTDFPKSAYTALASLHMAKARLDAGQVELSVQLLEHAMTSAEPEAVRVVARERLARVKLDMGDSDAALELINGAPSESGFKAQFAEIRGDIHRKKGELSEAARYYNEALDALEDGTGNREYLEIKREAVGEPEAPSGETS
jgi:predicted negative regulator of RcsB-dependent stress response